MNTTKDELLNGLGGISTDDDMSDFRPVDPDIVYITSDRFGRLVAAESIVEVVTRYLMHDNKPSLNTVKVLMGIEKGAEE